MNRLLSLTVSQSMAVIFALGFSAALLFGIVSLHGDYRDQQRLAGDRALLDEAGALSALVHELQRERGLTFAVLSSDHTSASDALTAQRLITDDVLTRTLQPAPTAVARAATKEVFTLETLTKWLRSQRLAADNGQIEADAYRDAMTDKIGTLVVTVGNMADRTRSRRLALLIRDSRLLMAAKDSVGLERALGAAMLAGPDNGTSSDASEPRALADQALVSTTILRQFTAAAKEETKLLLDLWQRSVAAQAFATSRDTLLTMPTPAPLPDAETWWAQADAAILGLRKVERALHDHLYDTLEAEKADGWAAMKANAFLLIALLLSLGSLALVTLRRVDQSIRNLIGTICRLSVDASTTRVRGCPQRDLNQISNALKILRAAQIERRRNLEAAELLRSSIDHRLNEVLENAQAGIMDRRIEVLGLDAHGAVLARGINRLLDQIERDKAASG
ncbi:hypothetical protein JANAI62_34280 [Jannaschia pagri]|uniref:Nitrate/nitrite sensing protein domain-containing protein n=1 Tax=Jannaschia pagri TaxID=2829797 RepID=A0ABQ4NQY3_9RHOB|nr:MULTISPECIES: nitrate- and nitrite sensing domain-containing protein [unclassified Jannaschia]GIT92970.1 hypothetical protein JANAI61_34280 [Jannaschia sp. AI_61]GIT96805.1 hypothetical protein JANAI62_34280 [Jannaschia sp. AI_62]